MHGGSLRYAKRQQCRPEGRRYVRGRRTMVGMTKQRVIVAMSGGVDSAVAAGLLVQQGYDVVGVTMRLWSREDGEARLHQKRCCGVEDIDDARAAAEVLGIP